MNELTVLLLATLAANPAFVTSGRVTVSVDELTTLRASSFKTSNLPTPEILLNILGNAGLESGILLPWETNNWTITSADTQSGSFAAEDIGNYWIEQCFSPIPVAAINRITFWSKQPDAAIQAVDLFYGPATYDEFIVFPSATWTFHDVTAMLRPTGSLEKLRVWGYSGGGPMVDLTLVDDFSVDASAASTPCIAVGFCGDGNLDPGESCDNGGLNSDTQPDACRLNCTRARCGDGVVDSSETCDDANDIPGDGCTECLIDACIVANILPIELLRGVKSVDLASVILTWTPDSQADGYNTWVVQSKQLIQAARDPGGTGVVAVAGCHPTASTSCWHLDAVPSASGAVLFYQVRGACSGNEAAE